MQLLLLFVFALNIPLTSFFAVMGAFFTCLLKGLLQKKHKDIDTDKSEIFFSRIFLISYSILLIFSVSYFITIFNYNLYEDDVPRTILLVNVSYLLGYNIKFDPKHDNTLSVLNNYIALIGGGAAFVFLCVVSSPLLDVVGRSIPNIWKSGEAHVNGTVLDLYSMLGTGLLSFIFFCYKKLKLHPGNYKLTLSFACAIAAISSFTTIVLQGRKAILSIALTFMLTIAFRLISLEDRKSRAIYLTLIALGTATIAVASSSIFEFLAKNFDVFARFNDEGLDSGRYQAWADILESMPNHVFGGRSFQISETFAHNIWLDVFYDGGFLPMLLLLGFHVIHIGLAFKVIRSKLPEPIIIFTICSIVPILMGFQGEPVLQASVFYFGITCFLFGSILRLSQVTDRYPIVAELVAQEKYE
jgi:hypothetical protein